MSLDIDLFNTLRPLVGNRVAEDSFPEPPIVPTWPAIRYTIISNVPVVDVCGDGDDETAEPTIQIDVVAKEANQRRTLRLQVMAAMRLFSPPAILDNWFNTRDVDTKTYRAIMQYTFHGSSPSGNSPP